MIDVQPQNKQVYINHKDQECIVIRETKETVTLLFEDEHEWTTTKRNFHTNYMKVPNDRI